ncbi:alpha/beta fold hydrolase [Paractinoplanes atraurantiacus]|uniref:Pimeloyl-ACP methyl ester carboxylesterase n=1 Tax=Paractinoplanes atraurantiacus TaxID=1036182 RepID=A0A285HGR1_9ACTN|nr:alpha/beta hydrolase [Actinoplanes atraurantiacus]SNY34930.1 Pimeloyl-ACP methyl ester carboxylesterase [Actinoplanes atraurantiacus]
MEIKARGLTFDVFEGGPSEGDPVLLLHGFPQDHREFDLLAPKLHEAGLRTYAMDQRGVSPGARPADVGAYRITEAVADAVGVLDALGLESAHVIGHDWGANVGWMLAAWHPERVRTLTAVSVPHPKALQLALRTRPAQRARLAYFKVFQSAAAERLLLANDAAALRWMLKPIGERAELYVEANREPGRLTGGLNWYRALTFDQLKDVRLISVPTTYVWSDKDGVVSLTAALRTRDWVDADYQMVAMRGISHWVPEQAATALSEAAITRIQGV